MKDLPNKVPLEYQGFKAEDKEDEKFKPIIPRGWTFLKHGTNLSRWEEVDPRTAEEITITKPLSVVSREDHERAKELGRAETAKTYSSAIKPSGMSEEEYANKNIPIEIRIMFWENHVNYRKKDPEYADSLGKEVLDKIATYYFLNHQNGRHPLIPRKEVLKRLGQVNEDGRDIIYFVPESIENIYLKEAGIDDE